MIEKAKGILILKFMGAFHNEVFDDDTTEFDRLDGQFEKVEDLMDECATLCKKSASTANTASELADRILEELREKSKEEKSLFIREFLNKLDTDEASPFTQMVDMMSMGF